MTQCKRLIEKHRKIEGKEIKLTNKGKPVPDKLINRKMKIFKKIVRGGCL